MTERDRRLLALHIEYARLCADDIITETEHQALDDALWGIMGDGGGDE